MKALSRIENAIDDIRSAIIDLENEIESLSEEVHESTENTETQDLLVRCYRDISDPYLKNDISVYLFTKYSIIV